MRTDRTSTVRQLDSPFLGGAGNPDGPPTEGPGTVHELTGSARRIEVGSMGSSAAPLAVTFQGEPGDVFWLLSSLGPDFRLLPPMGILQVQVLLPLPQPAGVLPASGSLTVPLDLTGLTIGPNPTPVAVQGFALGGGRRWLTGLRSVLAFHPTSGPDCNGNGIADYLDLLAGSSADANHNLVPDECPGG